MTKWIKKFVFELAKTLFNDLLHFPRGVGGIMVSIAAFQAVDPGSIPG